MELYEMERDDALARIRAHGGLADDYSFEMEYLPPDPDGGGMFTVQYEIKVTNTRTAKSKTLIGGIGMRWVDRFEAALEDGFFD